ncbi:MAG TPA: hypothetical protein DIC60_06015 [Lachnospiraceae bacterium]|nr:hypothetical protein [Lachnospiraceae bacterium]
MRSSENELHELFACNLETIQASTFLEPMSKDQKAMFTQNISIVLKHLSHTDESKVTLTFRGDNRGHLTSKLSSKTTPLSEEKLISLLFYFGDKSKHYYKFEDIKARNLRWLQRIEDFREKTYSVIFEKTRQVLKSKKEVVRFFCDQNKEFAEFFLNDNKSVFVSSLIRETNFARDYYLYFLHTAGKIGAGDKSVLVSTSLSRDVAVKFSGDSGERYVIYYIIPEPFENFGISYTRVQCYEPWLTEHLLPIYKGKALYPEQHEVAVKGALFSSFILGVRVLGQNKFIVNPHLFQAPNTIGSILSGLLIDQTDFENRLIRTGYWRGVGTYLDGAYETIHRTMRNAVEHDKSASKD